VLDLLAWVPALLVLARGAVDRTFRVRVTWAHGLLGALALLAVLSPFWAGDKFAAAVSGFHLVSAAVFLWGASQLVRSARRLRLVAGVCVALLLLFGTQALTYRYVEQPELRRDWEENRDARLRERGIEPGTFAATQLEGKVLRGEMIGFAASSNTFAATTVLLVVVTAGVVIQRLVNRDGPGWVALPLAGLAAGACIIVWADSKTAFLTPLLAAGILAALAVAGGWVSRRAKQLYLAGVVGFFVCAGLIVMHGRHQGTLFIDSLTFRWHYWVGAARVFAAHPILGVGWDNFGLHYLAVRLPLAAEEVRDPHNFIVRFATELGTVGVLLAAAWMLRLWWELTRPHGAAEALGGAKAEPRRALPAAAAVALVAAGLSVLATVDFGFMTVGGDAGPAYVLLRVLERCVGAGIALAGIWVATTRSVEDPTLDDRPAPWVMYAIAAGLGVFLLHNLVDFAMFELGPMFLFALLAGAALGPRQGDVSATPAPSTATRRFAPLAVGGAIWFVAAGVLALPVLIAEGNAAAGDEHLRRGQLGAAVQAYRAAAGAVPYNGEYWFRAARVLQSGPSPDEARQAFAAAIEANPAHSGYRAARGMFEARQPQPDVARVRADYDAALARDPANVLMRLDYAAHLEGLGLRPEAKAQYELALSYNDQLAPVEVERLSPARVAEVEAAIARLGASATQPT
jgi:O-antigen ligase